MLHGDEVVLHGVGFPLGLVEGRVQRAADIHSGEVSASGDTGQLPELRIGCGLEAFHGDVHLPQQLGDQSPVLLQQGHQKVNLLQLLMAVLDCEILRCLDSLL